MVRNPQATWEFPKGSQEDGESDQETALRELAEETLLEGVEILPHYRETVTYNYRRAGRTIHKTIIFFIAEVPADAQLPAEAPTREHRPHPVEGVWHAWGSEQQTRERLFHQGMRELLRHACSFLHAYDHQSGARP